MFFFVATAVAALYFLTILDFAFGQTYYEELQFYPEVPTERSNVTAKIFLTTSTPCHKVELREFELSDRGLSINVQVIPPPQDTVCILVLKGHVLEQSIGKLDAGAYDVRLYVNREAKAASKLYVTENDIAVLSTGRYTDEQGGVNLVGEVQNTAGNSVKRVRVDVAFFDQEQLFREEQVYTTMAIILPDRTSGFSLALDDELNDKDYSVRVTAFEVQSEPVEKALVLRVEPRLEQDGYGVILGSVSNTADREATQVKIVCVLYDSRGAAIDSIFGYTEPANIEPGRDAGFEIFTHHKITEELTTSCNAESTELAVKEVRVVPEFPVVSLLAAASLAAALAIHRLGYKLK